MMNENFICDCTSYIMRMDNAKVGNKNEKQMFDSYEQLQTVGSVCKIYSHSIITFFPN